MITSCGEVPQVIIGKISSATRLISLSNLAPSSVFKLSQYFIALSQFSFFGDIGLPFKYSNIFSSGAINPALAPPSIVILQIVIRCSTLKDEIRLPAYSMTDPVPPAVPIFPIICKITSLEVTPIGSFPLTLILKFFAFFWTNVCVARTCSTSEVPIPNAKAPNAPCVAVWLSPQTITVPGCVKPCSGPMIWTIPCLLSFIPKYWTPNSLQLFSKVSTWILDSASAIPLDLSVVGTLWSATASVKPGCLTFLLEFLNPSKACGLVTSWTKCLSTNNNAVPSSCWSTKWSFQILS